MINPEIHYMKHVVVAGGTGLIGRHLENELIEAGHHVQILTRNPQKSNHIKWDPANGEMDVSKMQDTQVIINLCGAGVADKRWSKSRKKELHDSRIVPAKCIEDHLEQLPALDHYVSASGITCYGYDQYKPVFDETDKYGQDYLSQLVKQWEAAADRLSGKVKVTKLRIAVVLTPEGGALPKLAKTVRQGIGSPLGSGNQNMPWIHINDLAKTFVHVVNNTTEGTFNAHAGNATNAEFMNAVAKQLGKKMWMPKVPGFVMKILLGEMAEMLLGGVVVTNERLQNTGVQFQYSVLDSALKDLLK